MRFRTTLLAGTVLVLVGMAGATVTAVSMVIERSAQRTVANDLRRSLAVLTELESYRRSLLRTQARVLRDEPRLRAVLMSAEISTETVRGVAQALQRVFEAELFVLADSDGTVVVDTADPDATGHELGGNRLVAEALLGGESSGTWTVKEDIYQVQARRIGFGEQVIGVVVIGYRLDRRIAEAVYQLTASTVIIEHHGEAAVLSSFEGGRSRVPASLARTLAQVPTGGAEPVQVELAGNRYLAIAARFRGGYHAATLRYVILRSLDRALAPKRRLKRLVFVTSALALPAALLLALLLARRLSRPIDELVAFTEKVAAGEVGARVDVGGVSEMQALGAAMNAMSARIESSQSELASKERLEKEMEIAAGIQTSILPRDLEVSGLHIAARMLPADDVGGDYYDVLPQPEGCFLAIGDVAGHGLSAGLVMMMVHNVLSAIVRVRPDATPAEICVESNRVLVDNVRERLQRDDFVTLTLLRYFPDGRILFAGAHESIVVWRARNRRTELIDTPGTWLAVMPEIGRFTENGQFQLEPGDLMVLYTDGITEAMNRDRVQFGIDRLCKLIEQAARGSVDAISERVVTAVEKWAEVRADDITVVVVRRA